MFSAALANAVGSVWASFGQRRRALSAQCGSGMDTLGIIPLRG